MLPVCGLTFSLELRDQSQDVPVEVEDGAAMIGQGLLNPEACDMARSSDPWAAGWPIFSVGDEQVCSWWPRRGA